MGRRGIVMTAADVAAHQARHFGDKNAIVVPQLSAESTPLAVPKGEPMTVPEREYGLILAAQKGRGEVLEYRFQGVSLAWGRNPKTGKLMRYKCDYFVIKNAFRQNSYLTDVVIVEVKGPRIWPKDLIRFRGCRAEWPMFSFELHQRDKDGTWRRVE